MEDKPFVIESPTRIRLGPQAVEFALEYMPGETKNEKLRAMAQHLQRQADLRLRGLIQGE